MSQHNTQGYALMMIMLFLPILSMLVLGVATNVLMEYKISNFYANKVEAFYQAEKILLHAEQQMLHGLPVQELQPIFVEKNKHCEVYTYSLTVTAYYNGAKSELCSIVNIGDNSKCLPEHEVELGRQSFWVAV